MERRPYFVLGDLLANAAVGALAGSVGPWLLDPALNMAVRMAAGMLIGMAIALLVALLIFAPLFGAMEIIVPCMLTGMLAGMVSGMRLTPGVPAAYQGAGIGVACIAAIYVANYWLVTKRRRGD